MATSSLLELVRTDLFAAFRNAAVAAEAGILAAKWASTSLPYVTYGNQQQAGHVNMGRMPAVEFWIQDTLLDSLAADGGACRFIVGLRISVPQISAVDAETVANRIYSTCMKVARADDGEDEGNSSRTLMEHGDLGWQLTGSFECVRTFQKSQQGVFTV